MKGREKGFWTCIDYAWFAEYTPARYRLVYTVPFRTACWPLRWQLSEAYRGHFLAVVEVSRFGFS